MMFDTTLRIADPQVQVMQDENGDSFELHLIAAVVMMFPVGPGQFAPIQTGILRLPLDKPTVKGMIDNLQEGYDLLKEKSSLVIGDMNQAEQLAAQARQAEEFRGRS